MAEVRLETELAHPPERVWQALTDARLLREWFMTTDLEPREGGQFTLEPGELAGFLGPISGELLELAPPRRMVMLWQGEKLHTRVVWELTETGGGCRLRLVQSGFIGAPATLRRRTLRAVYVELVTERLPGVLDRLASGQVDLSASPPVAVPRQRRPAPAVIPAPGAPAPAAPGPAAPGPAAPVAAVSRSGGAVGTADVAPPPADAPVPAPRRPFEPGAGPASAGETGPDGPAPPRRPWWREWLAAVPAWGRALVIGTGAAVLMLVVLLALTHTWLPWPGSGGEPWPGDERDGPGLAAQPGAGAADTTADPHGASPGPAPGAGPEESSGPGPDDSPGTPGASPQPAPGGVDPALGGRGPVEPDGGASDPPPPSELTATMTSSGRLLGLSGRTVSVTVSNPGVDEAATWEVILEVGDQEVTNVSAGAAYDRSGSQATFTPTGGALAVGENVQFSFDIPGSVLGLGGANDPTSCTIDGRPCD